MHSVRVHVSGLFNLHIQKLIIIYKLYRIFQALNYYAFSLFSTLHIVMANVALNLILFQFDVQSYYSTFIC